MLAAAAMTNTEASPTTYILSDHARRGPASFPVRSPLGPPRTPIDPHPSRSTARWKHRAQPWETARFGIFCAFGFVGLRGGWTTPTNWTLYSGLIQPAR